MSASGDDFGEDDMTSVPEDSLPEQKQETAGELGVGNGEKRWPGWPGETVFRILVPSQKVGGIIGRKGEFIKRMCEETKARIKILDGPPGTQERAVMISAKEEPDAPIPPAMDGLLRVHKRTVDGLDGDTAHAPPSSTISRLLVAASQAGSLIGKQGATIKSIQEASNCTLHVIGPEDLPAFVLQDDRIVEIQGDATGVHKAVELIASHLRKFLVDRSVIGIFETQMQMPTHQMEQNMPPHQSWGPPQSFPQNTGGGPGFGMNPQYMQPPRQQDNYYPPPDFPPMDRQPHSGLSAYGREPPMGVPPTNVQQPPSIVTQITQHMQVPLSYADAVIGTAGSNISYIRRASGATITIQETRGIPGEMTVEINGTASQVQTAQQLIQNFMVEAAGLAQNQVVTGPSDNSYANHASIMYSAPPSNDEYGSQAAGGYGSVYGGNYGY